GLVDLPRQAQDFLRSPELVGSESTGDHERVEIGGVYLINARVHRDRIAALSLIGAFTHAGDGSGRPFFFEPDLRIPQLQIFITRSREKQNAFAFESHGGNLYLLRLLIYLRFSCLCFFVPATPKLTTSSPMTLAGPASPHGQGHPARSAYGKQ